jgi:hypothetical protein
MTVKELIEKLKEMPQNATVLNGGDLFMELDTVEEGLEGDVILF